MRIRRGTVSKVLGLGVASMMLLLGGIAHAGPGYYVPAPELDPGLMASGLALLLGGGALLIERYRRN